MKFNFSDAGGGNQQWASSPLAAGTYRAKIEKAEERLSKIERFRDPEKNPDGEEMNLALLIIHNGERYRVWDSIPKHWGGKMNSYLRALNLPELKADSPELLPHCLEGREVIVEILVSPGGRPYVKSVMLDATSTATARPVAPKPSPAKPAPSKPGRKTNTVEVDDIPF